MDNRSEIIIYNTEDGKCKIDVRLEDDNVWLTQEQMAELFQKAKSTINEHVNNIYSEGELSIDTTMRKFGNSEFSTKPTNFYNLDMIISVGYRVKSQRGIQFRIWASTILKEYLKKGFVMDDERLKKLGGGGYFKELLERILSPFHQIFFQVCGWNDRKRGSLQHMYRKFPCDSSRH